MRPELSTITPDGTIDPELSAAYNTPVHGFSQSIVFLGILRAGAAAVATAIRHARMFNAANSTAGKKKKGLIRCLSDGVRRIGAARASIRPVGLPPCPAALRSFQGR